MTGLGSLCSVYFQLNWGRLNTIRIYENISKLQGSRSLITFRSLGMTGTFKRNCILTSLR